jgi:acetyl esterase/lipase
MARTISATIWAACIGMLTTAPLALQAQTPSRYQAEIAAPAEPDAIALLARPITGGAEQWSSRGPEDRAVRNVVNPTLTPVLPDPARATGVALIVAPGGAFRSLAIDSEGYAVARWLADHGVAAFVLKYRLVPTPRDQKGYQAAMAAFMTPIARPGPFRTPLDTPPEALADAQAAVRLVRQRAAEWRIDPQRVGFVGFSAGAMTTLAVGLADDKAARPDFIAPIYPPMSARAVPADAPPMFVAIALDDPLFAKTRPIGLIDAWRDARIPVEAHLYERGGHGFGMAHRSQASALWIDQFYAWMKDRRLIRP